MNDENFYKRAVAVDETSSLTPPHDLQRSGLRFARRVRAPRAVALGGMFFPIAAALVTHPVAGGWWLLLVGWAFVWPHLAWQIASRAIDPRGQEFNNLKADAILAGMWVGLMGMNALPSAALLMIVSMNLMGAGGLRLSVIGLSMMAVACLVTLQLTGGSLILMSIPLVGWLTLPVMVIYPLLFARLSYQIATRLAEHKRRLQIMSSRDGMTGVYNRRHWEQLLRNEFELCRRQHRECTLLIIDIDHFKDINDTWGHDVGDEAIQALTRQLRTTLRSSDVIGRFGGDEFAVIMCGTPAESAIAAMSRVHEGLRALRLACAPQVILHISVGVAPLTPQFGHYREWLKSADLALYKAKNAGRNRTEVAA
ncbi:diguanylate cyclase AdrA [Citrobacter rodentium]|uniref:diguanylate cyclase n=2 Tax=Citrobacter rodentium TaxID=67825 RepID=D2TKW9_CITRI|nr:diguanylate cyclase AdrA [Citrobacter rodentium]KIQ52765.1 diguanylate cyclase [Citrobacter rodentium]QBY31656.1 diguanylate cyclase AdrA [Citrobacter rodentium]UHO30986.1 diguanylate cyclase AdrA [Citrobacter rodentium NBRC 105723 = DSM 16636]CBG87210.1 putative signal transduction protein [Citrobacter rodentium ICC168]HAT8015644.1 diguanylate cyclase AdrA [Citrobacter rodentium NBRC 105723 = DSM 16636]